MREVPVQLVRKEYRRRPIQEAIEILQHCQRHEATHVRMTVYFEPEEG